jgi:hypothetical protein
MSGVINSDAGVNAAAALLVFLLVRGLRRGLTVPLGLTRRDAGSPIRDEGNWDRPLSGRGCGDPRHDLATP